MMARIEVIVTVDLGDQSTAITQSTEVHPRMISQALPIMAERVARIMAGQHVRDEPDT